MPICQAFPDFTWLNPGYSDPNCLTTRRTQSPGLKRIPVVFDQVSNSTLSSSAKADDTEGVGSDCNLIGSSSKGGPDLGYRTNTKVGFAVGAAELG